ncbi:clathrin-coated vesicle protein [Sparassis crispa]|uniref:Clathrin-coated vesicle protein n=1 Tax=Sparassis crispa TaxID=139825 RepID=A0A401GY60_9APHY|nr:clathrin-coated vesicle protein [Sparassis crispa]GBE87132.1 clathrin-coated vesicle protein [Sparassis crispa]
MPTESLLCEPIDESNFSNENGEIYLFQWLASTEKAVRQASTADLKSSQGDLEATLVKIVTAPEPYPLPGRPVRNLIAKCLISLYTRAETKTLFDTVQAFLKIVGDSKTPHKDASRVAALYCIGELMGVFGSQVMSLMGEIAAVTLKLSKSSSPIIIRYHALCALEKSMTTAKRAITDSVAKDIIKQMRHHLGDKALPVQRGACNVLILMYPSGDGTRSVSDVDSIISLCVRSLENSDQLTRRSLSKLAAHMLASTQVPRVVPVVETSKKGKKGQNANEDEEDIAPVPHVTAEEAKPVMTPTEMLNQLSIHFNRPQASRKTRIGIFDFYAALLALLGSSFVESNYPLIVNHFMTEIVSNPRNSSTRYEVLSIRSFVEILLRDLVGVRMLGEQAQITAIQELSNLYLKRWPAMMPGQTAPNSLCLAIALREVAGLLRQLGNAPPPVQDALVDPLLTLLSHPSHTIRVSTAWALRCFCYSTPLRLPKVLLSIVEMLQRDLTSLTTPAAPADIHTRALGHAYGLAALLAVIPERPLYVSYDISAKVFDMAVQLLKRAGEHEVKIARTEIEIAWRCIASLMTLGPNFLRAHLPQLLVLWRNALPKPTSKDGAAGRSPMEWMFLLHVRESALGAVHCFLKYNSPTLVTPDVTRRIASLLSNALQFANTFVAHRVEVNPEEPQAGVKELSLEGREALLRSRIFLCFSSLGLSSVTESIQSSLLQSAISLFASPDGYAGSSVQAAIASSTGAFTSVWHSVDGYAYGVTDIQIDDNDTGKGLKAWMNRDGIEISINDMFQKPIIGSCEHDPLFLCQLNDVEANHRWPEPAPPATAAVNAAIQLFAQLLPLQDLTVSTRTLTQLVELTGKSERNLGRKAAVSVNATVALVLALRQPVTARSRQVLGNAQITSALSSFLKDVLVDGDLVLRKASSEAIGRLANIAGTNFLTSQVKILVDQVVTNRDPLGRAGCAEAFGAIHAYVGGLAAGPLLKTTIHVLMSLINDPHPVVHFWALGALARVIDAASLAYAPFVPSTLGLLFKVYMMESHEPEGGGLNHTNLSGDLPTYQVVCQNIDAVITVLGPDIQDSTRSRTLVLDLVRQFIDEDDDGICVEAINCIQHFLMFAPEYVEVPDLVMRFRGYLSSSRRPLKLASINALYQLVQKDAFAMSRLGGDQLVEELFAMLDDDSSVDGVRNVIVSWLHQTVIHNPSAWIDLCQRIMSRTTASQQVADAAAKRGDLLDDEGQSLSVGSAQDSGAFGGARSTSRWRTQLFALQCLHSICMIVRQSSRKEHLDLAFARSQGLPVAGLLVSRVPDLIKIAFTASAAHVTEIRLEGLTVLRDIIEVFAKTPDPDYSESLLLEQHQAPITAALTPAFSSDSTPEILASAIGACAVFVGCGVVKDVNRMGRILKLLTSALEQSKESGMLSLGDAAELSPNASVMLRIATLSAWAELEVASSLQSYLVNVIKPYRKTLASLWIASLRDYASIRADTEAFDDSSSGPLDSSYSSLGREVLLPYYLDAWPVILQAVATAMVADDPHILAAMDGQDSISTDTSQVPAHRDEPTAFFFVVFGLVYETLVASVPDSDIATQRTSIIALRALKCLVQNKYCGNVFNESPIFDELINLFYRMALTEPSGVQIYLVETLASLSQNLTSTQAETMTNGHMSREDLLSLPQVHCLRICAYVLRRAIKGPRNGVVHDGSTPMEKVALINAAFDTFSTIALTFGPVPKEQFRAVAITLYSELLRNETSEVDLVGPTLQSLKTLLEGPSNLAELEDNYERVVHGLLSACLVNVDEMRGRQGAISFRKIKSNLLASVLVLTVISPSVKVASAIIDHCCFLVSQRLIEADEMSLTAAHCTKTLIMASASGNAALRQCARLLLPGMIECLVKIAASSIEGTVSEQHLAILGEIYKAFSTLFLSIAEDIRPRALGILMPSIILLLDPARTTPSSMHSQSVNQLLSFAAASPSAFKEATGKLSPEMRDTLEASIRQVLGNKGPTTEAPKPQISLRSF